MTLLALFILCVIFPLMQWFVRRDIERCRKISEEWNRETLERYRSHTTKGRRPACSDTADTIIGMTPEEKRATQGNPLKTGGN